MGRHLHEPQAETQPSSGASHLPVTAPNGPAVEHTAHPGLFVGIVALGAVVALALVVFLPNLRSAPGYLALTVLTPLLIGASVGLTRSGLRSRVPGALRIGLRAALLVVVLLDLLAFVLPFFTSGGTAHDRAPTFAATAPVATAAQPTTAAAEPTATPAASLRSGTFDNRGGADSVAGTARLGVTSDGQRVLRLEGLQATNGPDLYVYLTTVASPATNAQVVSGFEVSKLKATSGDQNYTLPATLDLARYSAVVIYCKSFSTVFGYANLM